MKEKEKQQKKHYCKLIDHAIVLLFITVILACAYLTYRLWDYRSADKAYADIESNAVRKVRDGFENYAKKNRDRLQSGWKTKLPDLLGSRPHTSNDQNEERIDDNGTFSQNKDNLNSARESRGNNLLWTYEEAVKMGMPIVSWDNLMKSGRDIVAWLEIPALEIGYPVVQGSDNEYYLHHLPNGEYKGAGSLFMEANNNSDFSDFNTIIYGHNMDNGSMFGKFRSMEQEDYERNSRVWICTKDYTYLYTIFSMHISHVEDDSYLLFNEISSFPKSRQPVPIDFAPLNLIRWVCAEASRSYLNMPVPSEAFDRILTLSTCASYSNERRVLQAILIKEFPNFTTQGGQP